MIGEREGGLRMTTEEERQERLEETDRILAELAQHQQEQLDGIIRMLQRQEEQLAEVREDTNMTRRMWVRLAKKHGWLDDEDVEGT